MPRAMLVYKILTTPQWDDLQARGQTPGAPVDLADGFVHLSGPDQVAGTLARHFAGQDGLVLLAIEAEGLTGLRWEVSRGGALFPHLYGPLRRDTVVWSAQIPLGPDGHRLPDLA